MRTPQRLSKPNPLTDPTRRPKGYAAVTCSAHGTFLAWCAPPAPSCTVRCSAACAEDGLACIECGAPLDGPSVPVGRSSTGSQTFACTPCSGASPLSSLVTGRMCTRVILNGGRA